MAEDVAAEEDTVDMMEVLQQVLIRAEEGDVVVVRAGIMVQWLQRTNNSRECHHHYLVVPTR
jgi:Trp operon repressor